MRSCTRTSSPPNAATPGICAKFFRRFYGTGVAPACWEALCTATVEGLGFARGRANACCFDNAARDLRCV
eukprot:7085929-Alexandrium_andersonii.AAC.1